MSELIIEAKPIAGKKPVYDDQNRRFRVWNINEIYGIYESGTFCPNIDDQVWDWENGLYRVVDVDRTNGLCTLQKYIPPRDNNTLSEADILLGIGPGYTSETFRLYMKKHISPITGQLDRIVIAVDDRLKFHNSQAAYVKIFIGVDISEKGRVLSMYRNSTGDVVSENIPLELVTMDNINNYCSKAPVVAWASEPLNDGELVTLVSYTDSGMPTSINKLLVMNTDFIRKLEDSKLIITGIGLDSINLSEYYTDTLEYPLNVTPESIPMMGLVYYNDGNHRKIPLDGKKMKIDGLDTYVPTILGQTSDLVLHYYLSPEEAAVDCKDGIIKHISKPYQARTTEVNGAWSLKLFVCPMWRDEYRGWGLDYYLYDLERKTYYNVSKQTRITINSAIFEPLLYGVRQELRVECDLTKVDSRLPKFSNFTQTFAITLITDGLESGTPWMIRYSTGQNPEYGSQLQVFMTLKSVGNWSYNVSCDAKTQEEWFDRLFYRTQPLFFPNSEEKAPLPTHMDIEISGRIKRYHVSEWNKVLTSDTGGTPGDSLVIHWVRKIESTELRLGASPIIIRHNIK